MPSATTSVHTMMTSNTPKRAFLSLRGSPVFAFRVLLGGIMVSTGIGVLYALSNRSALLESFPGAAVTRVYVGLLLVAGMGLAALFALWMWRRWGLVLYGIVVISSLVLDRMARAPFAHEVAVLVSAVAVFSLAYLNRTRFAVRESSNTQ